MASLRKKDFGKIIIIGDAARGKSTLAHKISKKLNIPKYSTDDYLYEIKFTKLREEEKSKKETSAVYQKEKWIMEGTTARFLKLGLDSADLIIYLGYKNIFLQWFELIKRNRKRKHERLIDLLGLMRHVLYKKHKLGYRKGKITNEELIAPYKNKVISLYSFKEIDTFLESIS